jgi:Flp pilus assembly protein TadD
MYSLLQIEEEGHFQFYHGRHQGEDEPFAATLAAYEEAIQLAPREGSLYYRKAEVLEQMGRHEEARQAFAQARQLGYSR